MDIIKIITFRLIIFLTLNCPNYFNLYGRSPNFCCSRSGTPCAGRLKYKFLFHRENGRTQKQNKLFKRIDWNSLR